MKTILLKQWNDLIDNLRDSLLWKPKSLYIPGSDMYEYDWLEGKPKVGEMLSGSVLTSCLNSRIHKEWKRFINNE